MSSKDEEVLRLCIGTLVLFRSLFCVLLGAETGTRVKTITCPSTDGCPLIITGSALLSGPENLTEHARVRDSEKLCFKSAQNPFVLGNRSGLTSYQTDCNQWKEACLRRMVCSPSLVVAVTAELA